jgi:hypothetical protein
MLLLHINQDLVSTVLLMCQAVNQSWLKPWIQLHDLRFEPFDCWHWETLNGREIHNDAFVIAGFNIILIFSASSFSAQGCTSGCLVGVRTDSRRCDVWDWWSTMSGHKVY